MPKAELSIEVDMLPSVAVLLSEFAWLETQMHSFKRPMEKVVKDVMGPSLTKNFQVGGRPQWEHDSEQTAERKGRYGYLSQTMVRTKALMRAAGSMNIWTIRDDEAAIESLPDEVQYGLFHQEGTVFMPQREWAVMQPEDLEAMEGIFMEWMHDLFERVGFH